jgi:hypothetical protein
MFKALPVMLLVFALLATGLIQPTPAVPPLLAAELLNASLLPTGDTYVDAAAPDANYAAGEVLLVGRDEFLQERFALLQFDLASLPAGAQIATATLELALTVADPGAPPVELRIEQVQEPWQANTANWNNRPATLDTGMSNTVSEQAGAYIHWDATALARAWLADASSNNGLAIRGPATTFAARGFGSAEFGKPPRLVVQYTNGPLAIDLRVALEWEPGNEDGLLAAAAANCPGSTAINYRDSLAKGLREAAQYLYSLSEGQITLGSVTIGTDEKAWQAADIRVLASSGYRPTAFVGGVVDEPVVHATPGGRPVIYYPAPILLGRLWDGSGARCGSWSEPEGWRTLGHELGHHALFLYDQYFSVVDGAAQYCSSSGLRFLRPRLDRAPAERTGRDDTLMAYHYTTDKLRSGGLAAPVDSERRIACSGSPHDQIHPGRTDWDVLQHFYPSLRIPPAGSSRTDWDSRFGAAVETPGIFSVRWDRPSAYADTSAPVGFAPIDAGRWHGEAFLLREGSAGEPARIVGQGWRLPGEASPPPLLGVEPGSSQRAVVFFNDHSRGLRQASSPNPVLSGGLEVADTTLRTIESAPSNWRPTLLITPSLTSVISPFAEVTALNVYLTDCVAATSAIDLAHCPAGGNCSAPVRVPRGSDGRFSYSFAFPLDRVSDPPALYGYIYARSVDTGEEAISAYQLAGGVGPAHIDGHAPLVEGPVGVEVAASAAGSSGENRIVLHSTPVCLAAGLPAGIASLVGAPLSVQISLAANPQLNLAGRNWGAAGSGDPDLRVRLFYDQALLDLLGVDEEQLVVLRFEPNSGSWQVLPEQGRSNDLNWIAAAPQGFGGAGAVFALAVRNDELFVPLVRQ